MESKYFAKNIYAAFKGLWKWICKKIIPRSFFTRDRFESRSGKSFIRNEITFGYRWVLMIIWDLRRLQVYLTLINRIHFSRWWTLNSEREYFIIMFYFTLNEVLFLYILVTMPVFKINFRWSYKLKVHYLIFNNRQKILIYMNMQCVIYIQYCFIWKYLTFQTHWSCWIHSRFFCNILDLY